MKKKALKQFVTELITLVKAIPAHSYADVLEQKAQEYDSVHVTAYSRTIQEGEIEEEVEIEFKDSSHISIIKEHGVYTIEINPAPSQIYNIGYQLISINKCI